MTNSTKKWIHGLVATAITGLGNGLALGLANNTLDMFKDTRSFWTAVLVTTVVSVAAYLKQSPLPYYEFEGCQPDPQVSKDGVSIKPVFPSSCSCYFLSGLSSCATTIDGKVDVPGTVANAKPYLRPAASAIGVSLLIVTKENESKQERANWLFAVSTAIKAISSDTPPTAEELNNALMGITPSDQDDWIRVVASIVGLYSSFKSQFGPDTQAVLDALEQISLGLQDASRPYVRTVSLTIWPKETVCIAALC